MFTEHDIVKYALATVHEYSTPFFWNNFVIDDLPQNKVVTQRRKVVMEVVIRLVGYASFCSV